jgi:hypothetical protein
MEMPINEARVKPLNHFLVLATLACVLGACGGGSGDSSASAPGTGSPPPEPAPAPAPPTSGNATLSWTPPTSRSDGSTLTDLAGYRILYGRASGVYDHVEEIHNPGISVYVVENLESGTWYFAIQSRTSEGLVSVPSAEVSTSI